jgi:Fur family ferric uptake transcriptional regulator
MLRGAGLRVTRPRVAVLSAVHDHPHADTDSVIRAVRHDLGEVSHQAVYDVLRALTAARLLRRIQPSGSVARYESRVGDNHHHVVCRSCGAIADVDCAVGTAPCLEASDDHGFSIDEAEVVYWALCPDCVAEEAATDGSARTRGTRAQHSDMTVDAERPRSTATSHPKRTAEQEKD